MQITRPNEKIKYACCHHNLYKNQNPDWLADGQMQRTAQAVGVKSVLFRM